MQDIDDKLLVHVNGLWWVRVYTKLEIDHKSSYHYGSHFLIARVYTALYREGRLPNCSAAVENAKSLVRNCLQ